MKPTSANVSNEKGFVLVTALILMVVLTVIMIGAYLTTANELAVSGNYRAGKIAFYQADAGVQYTLGRIQYELNGDKNASPAVSPKDISEIDPSTYSPPSNLNFSISPQGLPWSGNGPHTFVSTGSGPNGAECKIKVQFIKTSVLNPAFTAGLLSDGNITIHGSPNITGNIHANGSISQTGSGTITGNVSAGGTTSVGASVSGTKTPNADLVDVPSISTENFNSWRTKAQTSPNLYHNGDYTFSDSGNLGGRIIFVDGDVTVSGDIINGTIIATGNITINGSSQMDGSAIGTAMIAGGNIRFNGSSNSYGVFWCNGSYEHNGSGTVHGSIVSKGDITRNGSFSFTYNDNITNDNLTKSHKVNLSTWVDQRYLS